jgi:hypothetical protein
MLAALRFGHPAKMRLDLGRSLLLAENIGPKPRGLLIAFAGADLQRGGNLGGGLLRLAQLIQPQAQRLINRLKGRRLAGCIHCG